MISAWNQLFHTLETVVSYAWNSCFIRLKQLFHALETVRMWDFATEKPHKQTGSRHFFAPLSKPRFFRLTKPPLTGSMRGVSSQDSFTYYPMRVGAFVFRPSNLGVLTDSSVFVAFKKFVRFMWSASRFLLWVCSSAKSKKYDRFAENRRVVKGGYCKFLCDVFAAIVP